MRNRLSSLPFLEAPWRWRCSPNGTAPRSLLWRLPIASEYRLWCFSSVRFDLRRDFHKEAAAYRPALPLSIPILAIWLAIGWLVGGISGNFHFYNGCLLVPLFLGAPVAVRKPATSIGS